MIKNKRPAIILWAFVLSSLYLVYLAFTTQMIVIFDAQDYESIGKLIKSGWVNYYINGPQREPLFPLLIAFAMDLGEIFKTSYHNFIRVFSLLLFFVTQLIAAYSLKQLKVKDWIIALVVIYMALSGNIIGTTLGLWSEKMTFPFALLVIVLSVKLWEDLDKKTQGSGYLRFFVLSLLLSLTFVCLTLTKGVTAFLFLVFMIIFAIRFFFLFKRDGIRTRWERCAVFFATTLTVFTVPILAQSQLNAKYNGQFTFTNRSDLIFFSEVNHRTEVMRLEYFLPGIVFQMNRDLCYNRFEKASCDFWIDAPVLASVAHGDSLQKIFAHPARYLAYTTVVFMGVTAWDHSNVSVIALPGWLEHFYWQTSIGRKMPTVVNTLTFFVFWGNVLFVLFHLKKIGGTCQKGCSTDLVYVFFIFVFIFFLKGINAMGNIDVQMRIMLTVAPMFLVLIGYSLDRTIKFFMKTRMGVDADA